MSSTAWPSVKFSAVLGRFWLKGQTNYNPSPPGWGWGDGLMSHPSKKIYIITESGHTSQDSRRSVENLWLTEREEVRKVGRQAAHPEGMAGFTNKVNYEMSYCFLELTDLFKK